MHGTLQSRGVLEQKLPWELKPLCAFCSENADQAAEMYNLQKITLLREISLKTGVQVRSISSLLPSSSVLRSVQCKLGQPCRHTVQALRGLGGINPGIRGLIP